MEVTLQNQSIKQDLITLLVATAITFAGYMAATVPHYLPTSKIEEGTVVVKNDSITTIIIPDKL